MLTKLDVNNGDWSDIKDQIGYGFLHTLLYKVGYVVSVRTDLLSTYRVQPQIWRDFEKKIKNTYLG